ncbi:MAG TPA: hypothetical protein VGA56_22300 [Opitutaceae bacterium]
MGIIYRVKNGEAKVFLDVRGNFPEFICDPGVATGLGSFSLHTGPFEALRGKYVFGDIVNGQLFFMKMNAALTDRTIYELHIVRNGAPTSIKALAQAERAHLRLGYDNRTGDLFILTKDDGMVRKVTAAYSQ